MAELLVVVALAGLVASLVLPPLKRGFDRLKTRGAAQDTIAAFFVARSAAIALGRFAHVAISAPATRVAVVSGGDTLLARDLGALHGVTVTATRDSMAYSPNGLAYGGANLSVVLRRGSAAETVLVSREGRAKIGMKARVR